MSIELLILSAVGALIAMGISFYFRNPLILRGLLASSLALIAVARSVPSGGANPDKWPIVCHKQRGTG